MPIEDPVAAAWYGPDVRAIELSGPMDTSPIGLKKNWVTDSGGLPLYIRAVAHAFIRKGVPESAAIERAVGVVRNWAHGGDGKGGHVTAATVARATAAIAQWEAMKAGAHAHASDLPSVSIVDLAGMFTESLHPRAAGGKFGNKGGSPVAAARARNAPKTPAAQAQPGPAGPMTRAQQLRYQASQDRHLAHQIMIKVAGLVRARDAAIAGISAPKAAVSVKAATRKKAATTRKVSAKSRQARAAAKIAAAARAGKPQQSRVQRLNGQIRLLTHDARLLAKAANHLDQQAAGM